MYRALPGRTQPALWAFEKADLGHVTRPPLSSSDAKVSSWSDSLQEQHEVAQRVEQGCASPLMTLEVLLHVSRLSYGRLKKPTLVT